MLQARIIVLLGRMLLARFIILHGRMLLARFIMLSLNVLLLLLICKGEGSPAGGGSGPTSRPRGQPPQNAASQKQQQRGVGGAGVQVGAAAPEEKTWWQKNWLMAIGVGMAVMNILGNLAKTAQQPQQAAGAATGTRGAAQR
jgi:multisubunit Na+/H+ antiporter MnhB subunit